MLINRCSAGQGSRPQVLVGLVDVGKETLHPSGTSRPSSVNGQLAADSTGLSGIDHLNGQLGVAGILSVTDPAGDPDRPVAEHRDMGLVTSGAHIREPPLHL